MRFRSGKHVGPSFIPPPSPTEMAMRPQQTEIKAALEPAASGARNRLELWSSVIRELRVASCCEVGVFRGDFARHVLQRCEAIEKYYMVDPWRHLDDWNKPANRTDDEFTEIKDEALA